MTTVTTFIMLNETVVQPQN